MTMDLEGLLDILRKTKRIKYQIGKHNFHTKKIQKVINFLFLSCIYSQAISYEHI